MSNDLFIPVRATIARGKKHRDNLGNRVWLYLYILNRADPNAGVVTDWRDHDAADELAISWRTLQRQRQELAEMGYISCKQHKDHLSITINSQTSVVRTDSGATNDSEYQHPDFFDEIPLAKRLTTQERRNLRTEVLSRDGWKCKGCGATVSLAADHIIPRSKGGPTTLGNLQTLCKSCNSKKGARTHAF